MRWGVSATERTGKIRGMYGSRYPRGNVKSSTAEGVMIGTSQGGADMRYRNLRGGQERDIERGWWVEGRKKAGDQKIESTSICEKRASQRSLTSQASARPDPHTDCRGSVPLRV